MSDLQGGIHKKSPTAELEIIKQKRVALQKLVKLTGMLNRLHNGLQSVIFMGRTAAQLPKNILTRFKSLNKGLKNHPTEVLKNTLLTTDQKIYRDIKHVLEISQKSDALLEQQLNTSGDKLADVLKDDYHEYVNDFKKKSQTSITLRIALETRNVIVNTFKLPVPESFIKKQIISLTEQESECVNVIKKDMCSLQDDLDSLMKRKDCSSDVREIILKINSELKANTDHIGAGKPIDEMPMLYETVELSGDPQAIKEIEALVEKNNDATGKQSDVKKIESDKKNTGFLQHLWWWLNSPWKKSWKDFE